MLTFKVIAKPVTDPTDLGAFVAPEFDDTVRRFEGHDDDGNEIWIIEANRDISRSLDLSGGVIEYSEQEEPSKTKGEKEMEGYRNAEIDVFTRSDGRRISWGYALDRGFTVDVLLIKDGRVEEDATYRFQEEAEAKDYYDELASARSCPHCGSFPLVEEPDPHWDPRDAVCTECGQLTWNGS